MFADLDPKSAVPLYEQIAVRLKTAVATGELRAGEALPSVRQLAGKLRINPATVVQAYRALEDEGFVEMRQGAGSFVKAVQNEAKSRERAAQARRLIRLLLADAARLGLTQQELRGALRHELEGGSP
ncbi:MAG: GntR family transcriptional regulator [Gemmatimonadales bacterium]|nr:GntR family transcriptional regulator [Gemmatimonadales bacterium]